MLILRVLACLLFPVWAHAAVLELNEWNDKLRAGWDYSSLSGNPTIDNATDTPSGGGTIRANFSAGTYTSSVGGGTSTYTIPISHSLTEIYAGHWIKFSSPFDWNPQNTKFMFTTNRNTTPGNIATGKDNWVLSMRGPNTLVFTEQLWWTCPACTQNRYTNVGGVNIQLGRWYWIEAHARMNTIGAGGLSSVADGLIEVWIDDALVMRHNDVILRTNDNVFGLFSHAPVWGGGGGTISQTQHMWWDHTVLSTTRIGRPGTTPPGDTIAPRSPTLNFAN